MFFKDPPMSATRRSLLAAALFGAALPASMVHAQGR